jgi:hypothetical protein
MYPMEGVTMVRTCLIVISEGDTPMICEVSTPKITGFKSLNKNHPGNLKISQVFEIIQKILNWLIFSLLGPGAYGKSLSGEGGLGGGFVWSTRHRLWGLDGKEAPKKQKPHPGGRTVHSYSSSTTADTHMREIIY